MALGPVMLDLEGTRLSDSEAELLRHPNVGGVILFTRNYESPEQVEALVRSIHELRTPHLIVAVDQEGGRVQRFREGFTRLPAMQRIGDGWQQAPETTRANARELGWLMGVELRCVGVDLSFAPVADLGRGISGVIGDRAFHAEPAAVAALAAAWMDGMHEAGIAACAKHYPGHGSVREDSHLAHPADPRPLAQILALDLRPFRHLVRLGVASVMPAHVVYPRVDRRPAGYSSYWLQDLLRRELGFEGAVLSDDLSMSAADVAGDPLARAQAALAAGCDMVLVCNHPAAARSVVQGLGEYANPVAQARLIRLHGRGNPGWAQLRRQPRWHAARALAQQFIEAVDGELNV